MRAPRIGLCRATPAGVAWWSIHAAPELVASLATYYRERLGVDVRLPGAVQADSLAFDSLRGQLVAEEAIKILRDRHGALAASGPVIAVTSWTCTSAIAPGGSHSRRGIRLTIVSYARMDPVRLGEAAGRDRLASRLRKMVSRNVGVLLFGLAMNPDRTSLMSRTSWASTIWTARTRTSRARDFRSPRRSHNGAGYSHLNNVSGSVRDARRAGIQIAPSAAANRKPARR